ncbi:MAG: LysR family transcriptional regulator [Kurthia sp.]|nr:LysR family transcriptional regulator [Candidatus Kurthia equi]
MLDKFKTFVALAKYKSFTATAQQLFCSQPTISQHIKILEAHYNVQLIQRQKGEVILTPKGQQFLKYVQSILDLHSNLQETMNEPEKGEKEISIYVSHYLATSFFDELFSMNDSCGVCPYKVESNNYKGLKEALIEEKTSFAIMPYYSEDEELGERFTVDVLFEEKFVLIVPNEHPLAKRKVIYAKDLQNENILLPLSTFLQQRIRGALEEKNIFPSYSQMSDFNLIQRGVHQNMGIGFVPVDSIDKEEKRFTVKGVKGIQITRKNALIMNRFKELNVYEKSYYDSVKLNLTQS